MSYANDVARFVPPELAKLADPEKAVPMAAYMKTTMPFYGVQKPHRDAIVKEIRRRWGRPGRVDLERAIRKLWKMAHREEKYVALQLASEWDEFVTTESLPLYEKLIREGAWWDFVDHVAVRLVGKCWREDPGTVGPLMDEWIDDDDFWIRRTAIIAQVSSRGATDWRRLSRYARLRMHEKEFFIRKAIGWALRAYSATEPDRVSGFLERNRAKLSGLSFREGAKALRRAGIEIAEQTK